MSRSNLFKKDSSAPQKDKYSAIWVSHSSMGDFLRCPRLYYLHNIYKDSKTGRKINIVNPALSLGQAVHEVLEGLVRFKVENRLNQPLFEHYEQAWAKIAGKKGGFSDEKEEMSLKERGREMIERVMKNPGPIANKTVKLKEGGMLPHFYLSEEENIILCGKIDWLEYREEDDSIRVLDFKTGKNEEKEGSLQLPIYFLLLKELQKREISGAYYWYIDSEDKPRAVDLPDLETSKKDVLSLARKVKEAREKKEFECPRGGCFACEPYEKILKGEALFVGVGEYKQDLYMLK
jgi:ATP-dependent helicase/DNAse subunit B